MLDSSSGLEERNWGIHSSVFCPYIALLVEWSLLISSGVFRLKIRGVGEKVVSNTIKVLR